MKIKEIIYKEEYLLSEVDANIEFSILSTNPKTQEKDFLLILTKDEYIISDFTDNMPIAVICGINTILPNNIPSIRVVNPRATLANAYFRYEKIDLNSCTLIGITGTNGKSSTAGFIHETLSNLGHKVGLIGTGKISIGNKVITNDRYSMTTPDPSMLYPTLRRMTDEGCDIIVMEVSSHALALDKLAPLKFDYGLFTNLTPEHLDFHQNIDNYFLAKNKLFSMSKCGIFNIDDPYARKAMKLFEGRKISSGIVFRGDVYATNIDNHGLNGINYIYHGLDFYFKLQLKTPGLFNVYNSMMAIAACIDIGEKPCLVKECMKEITPIAGRYQIIQDDITVVIDYAHTDYAFYNILKELHGLKTKAEITVIFGCGGMRDKTKRPKMAETAERFANKIIITTDNPRTEDPKEIIADIIKGFKNTCYVINENRKDAIRTAILSATTGEIIAILGKGCEKYFINAAGYIDYDEEKIVKSALKERKEKIICE